MVLRSVISAAVLILYYVSTGLVIRQIGYGQSNPAGDVRPYQSMPGPRAGVDTVSPTISISPGITQGIK
jgi:hypothetical protein